MKKSRTVYILFFLALAGMTTFFCWKYISSEKVSSSSLPLVKITFPDDAKQVERNVWTEDCNVRIYDATGWSIYSSTYAKLEGRGHSTSDKPKKPYNIKLDQPESFFGLPTRDRWVLLANFFDHSLMRNALGQEIARQTSLAPNTPHGRFVQVEIDKVPFDKEGASNMLTEYQGLYYMSERVLDMVDDETVLLEFDTYGVNEDKSTFRTQGGLPVSVRKPKNLPVPLFETIQELVNRAEADPMNHIDLDTFADFYLVEELCQNGELNGPRSCFMHLLPDGRFAAGPVWDFDLSFIPVGIDQGNDLRPLRKAHMPGVRLLTSDSLYNARSLWYGRLLKNPAFVSHVQYRWNLLKPHFEKLTTYMDSLDHLIRPVAILDQQQWNHLEPARFDTCTTYPSAFATLKATYQKRLVKLDSLVMNLH
jgi:hypothetical protein